MAVGVSFTFLQDVDWNFMMYVFAVVAFSSSLLSALGMGIGIVVGKKLQFPTSFIGGVILISIAIKIVIEYFTEI
jgi:putative Mn2+ efflux pump MntP